MTKNVVHLRDMFDTGDPYTINGAFKEARKLAKEVQADVVAIVIEDSEGNRQTIIGSSTDDGCRNKDLLWLLENARMDLLCDGAV